MITNIGSCGKQKLLNIFNKSWSIGRLPKDWKRATVIPIRKVNKPAGSPDSYHPVALTNIICKVLEKLVLNRINFHLESNNLLSAEQYGFRKGHCTQNQILFFTQQVKDAQNKKPTNHTIAILLDLTKAFDRVWRYKLITKLYDRFAIDGKALLWIYDFLRNRVFNVKYNGSLSSSFR
ncbi:putative RNA-directed DNA polymerase from transposon BS [Araneus ventricosus]|uniref:Putative RNA-directed DNA polymerase from transposon BS n=1 Tax=Araneus ventricosus TaxID=182803 RepID=A0A4Y2UVH9_ARAVE|nr:putative RNA-directed DNA polymerase from transposon BS [Araneus ventricosus]